jgi:uncharacterized membrane protein YkoI
MNRKRLALPALFLLAGTAVPLIANAFPFTDQPGHQLLRLAQKNELSLDQAAARVRKETGGRVLSARTQNRNGHTVHRIKVLMPSGHVKIVRVDAATGKMY